MFSGRGWSGASGRNLPGLAAAARAPEPVQTFHPGTLKEAVVEPFRHLLARPGAGLILAFVVVYMLGNSLGLALLVPFLQELGFSLTEVGLATKAVGLVTVVAGGLAGGWLMSRWPLRRSLLVFGVVLFIEFAFRFMEAAPVGA